MAESTARDALRQAAAGVVMNRLNSDEWAASLGAFDELKAASHEAVLQAAADVKDLHLTHQELAAMLLQRASTTVTRDEISA